MWTDAHIHIKDLALALHQEMPVLASDIVCASSHSIEDFLWHESYALQEEKKGRTRVILSFGVHPQNPDSSLLPFLENLLVSKKIQAIGECGYDLFTESYRAQEKEQRFVREVQFDLACKFALPLVIHARKAMPLVFKDTQRLKKIPSLIFHGWAGGANEAKSLLSRGINAYFCAGKNILKKDRSLIATMLDLPLDRILAETDAPYMQDVNEAFTQSEDIQKIYEKIAFLRKLSKSECESLIKTNFYSAYGLG